MSGSSETFLGIIAISVMVMALLQLGAVVMLGLQVKKLMRITDDVQRQIKPIADRVHAIAEEAHRAAALATRQVQRVDDLMADVTRRVDETGAAIQSLVTGPLRQGSAVLGGLRAVLTAVLTSRSDRRYDRDEDDNNALFVG